LTLLPVNSPAFLFFLNLFFPAGIAVDHFLIFHLSQDAFHWSTSFRFLFNLYVLLPANFFPAFYLIIVKFLGNVGQALIEHFISSFLFFSELIFSGGDCG